MKKNLNDYMFVVQLLALPFSYVLAFLPIDGILRNGYVNFLPKESTDFTMNVSGDEEIISIP